MIPFCHWAAETAYLAPDVVLHECAGNFPPDLLEVFFDAEKWDMHTIAPLSPDFFGWPVNRPRRYTVIFNKETVRSTFDLQKFAQLFQRRVITTGDVFFVASDALLSREVQRLAKRRKCSPALASGPHFNWASLYAPCTDRILKAHEQHRVENNIVHQQYFCDLDQNMGMSSKAGSHIPSLLRHGHVWSFSKQRHMVEEEHLLAHGFPSMEACGTKWRLPWLEAFESESCKEADRKSLVGNSMHLAVMTSMLGYVLATTRKINQAALLFSASTVFDKDDGEDLILV
jgi:hypothetical protein